MSSSTVGELVESDSVGLSDVVGLSVESDSVGLSDAVGLSEESEAVGLSVSATVGDAVEPASVGGAVTGSVGEIVGAAVVFGIAMAGMRLIAVGEGVDTGTATGYISSAQANLGLSDMVNAWTDKIATTTFDRIILEVGLGPDGYSVTAELRQFPALSRITYMYCRDLWKR
jgi:hypothetical protein